ncbi:MULTISPECIES: hypothetical protein [Clostridium]|uniref:Uncharacterized protein n=1 Tax=Clostridium sporogenes TaxID=1509 RepID=A0ABX4K7Z8_CLOSG|nr:hypothetical protein [Clostridium sporogenes]AVP60506.1 hypothetical protein C7M79_07250 [Clostridium botulinum]EHN16094.1 hypothetical protein IYC_05829 [Clostridium sporogenes PA 3679]MBA4509069.1 hypothetical protein [Clostridium sporogenes]MBW5456990.1 hypothetical protein [Clostridium sporogenes]MCW6088377.1 hypothetical protein [Clostridium sporogenes]
MDENTTLTQEVYNNITNHGIDIGIDYLEIGIDTLSDETIISKIPFIKTIYSVFKIGNSIRDIFFTKKLIIFLQEYHKQKINEEQLAKFKKMFDKDNKYKNKVIEDLLVIIDRLNIDLKSKMLAKLFRGYIEDFFDWDTFLDLSNCIERLFIMDIKMLEYLKNYQNETVLENIQIEECTSQIINALQNEPYAVYIVKNKISAED